MAELLGARGAAAPKMYSEVFAREPEASRALVQPVTPPMSDAAREAYEALQSAQWAGPGADAPPPLTWGVAPRQQQA